MSSKRPSAPVPRKSSSRSEEHTSELQSRENLVCRLLLEKKKKQSPRCCARTSNNGKTRLQRLGRLRAVCARHHWSVDHRRLFMFFFFFNDTATTEIYTLSLHDALPISGKPNPPSASDLVSSSQ